MLYFLLHFILLEANILELKAAIWTPYTWMCEEENIAYKWVLIICFRGNQGM